MRLFKNKKTSFIKFIFAFIKFDFFFNYIIYELIIINYLYYINKY